AARARLRVLLLQVRDQPRALHHEQLCFLERLAIPREHLACVNVAEEPVPTWREAAAADLVILGGAGAHSAYLDYPFTEALGDLVRRLVETGRPFFGSCFGHQFLGRVLGGSVISDHANAEVGTFDVELHRAGRRDELFRHFPPRFPVHLGHHDRIAELPAGLLSLAASERCDHQIVRVAGKPIYGTQFHCEMSSQHMLERLMMYQEDYLPGEDPLTELGRRLRPTVQVEGLLGRFVDELLA
ncbi:MAG TPA: type 1 glutamine amidotransferase, partial [Thermoanaerobaculia bacterium]|nr:type 1 glutamine amidotransferase [Thermoanaerobaculia bacterium]